MYIKHLKFKALMQDRFTGQGFKGFLGIGDITFTV